MKDNAQVNLNDTIRWVHREIVRRSEAGTLPALPRGTYAAVAEACSDHDAEVAAAAFRNHCN